MASLVFFLDQTNIGIWMDGQLVKNVPHNITSGDFSANTPFYLLRETNEVNRWLGDVDEFAVYRGVLSQAEILDHYNNGAGKYYASTTETTTVAQAPASDFQPVSYQLPNITNLGPVDSPLQQTSTIASFTYDGDGNRVKSMFNGTATTYFVGAHYEVTGSTVTKYYYAGAQRIAMRTNGTLNYLLGDHLGSTSLVTDASGNNPIVTQYKAWGEVRYASGALPTKYQFTGQYSYISDFGFHFYNARWYDSYITQFSQPDSIVPDPYNSLDWNRYAYARYNPLKYTDPTGHDVDCGVGDSYCDAARREYYYSWRTYSKNSNFKTFLRAKEAHEFYYKNPDVALNDMFAESQGGSSWEDVDSYTLAKIYSENVKHQLFNPVSDQSLVWEMDRLNAVRNAGGYVDPKKWAALAAALFITFGPDGGSGGGGAGYTNDWYRSTFPSAGASAQYHWNKHGSQWSSIEGYTQAAKDFYSTNINLAKPWPINNGQEMGVKITTRDYFGIYTTDGRIVTFGPR